MNSGKSIDMNYQNQYQNRIIHIQQFAFNLSRNNPFRKHELENFIRCKKLKSNINKTENPSVFVKALE